MSTEVAKQADIQRKWFVVDLEGKVLGRAATEIARVLRGKHKAIYTPSVDTGDFVVVVNAEKVRLTGNKEQKKIYQRYSGYMGGRRERTASEVRARKPTFLIEAAVRGMMPRSSMGRQQWRKLKVYAGPTHPHEAQQPQPLEI